MKYLNHIFSIKNKDKHKVITILGLKLKFKRSKIKPNFYFDVKFNVKDKSITFVDYKNWDCRNISSIYFFNIVLNRLKNKLKHSFSVRVVTDDFVTISEKCMAYAKTKNQDNVYLIPDFFFDAWDSIGCKDFDDYMQIIVQNSKTAPKYSQLFWSGSLDIHPSRELFYEMSKTCDKLACIPISWKRESLVAGKELEKDKKISLKDFNQYKYLIDLPCRGYSGRFKALLFSGRPVFKAETDLEEYFYKDLKPFVHYIPVKDDLSDLLEKLEWAENNYDKALDIAKNAQNYAINNLTKEASLQFLELQIYSYLKGGTNG